MTPTLWTFCTPIPEKPWASALGSSSPSGTLTSTPMVVKCSPAALWGTSCQWLEVSSSRAPLACTRSQLLTRLKIQISFYLGQSSQRSADTDCSASHLLSLWTQPAFPLPSPFPPDFMEVMKCEHERAVHLFVDSLMNRDHMSFAFQCTDPTRFRKGICLSCRKNRCNNIGYNTRKMRKRRNSKMYLKTRARTPFGGEWRRGRDLLIAYLILQPL